MCRWLAYRGDPIFLSSLLFDPEHSLIVQSLRAREMAFPTNGDGFGIGWYGTRSEPGLFRDVLPAWNDDNLRDLAQQVQSGLFLAHVRASTGTATSRANCHPFRQGRWLCMHNGQIGEYHKVRRELDLMIAPHYYERRLGTTDSEAMFLLAFTLGLEDDVPGALAAMVGAVEALMAEKGATAPLRISMALTDSERLWALRYASDERAPTLYVGHNAKAMADAGLEHPTGEGLIVLSEPLDAVDANWWRVPAATLLCVGPDGLSQIPFVPRRPH